MSKAFSLLEMIIIMSIIAVLFLLGYIGFSNYRTTVQLQNAYSEFTTGLKSLQNKANNSTSVTAGGTRISPFMFAIKFNNVTKTHQPYYCTESGTSGTLITCSPDNSEYFSNLDASSDVEVTSGCAGIGFIRLTSDLSLISSGAFDGVGNFNKGDFANTTCTVTLTHSLSQSTRTIVIDLIKNTFQ